MNRRIAVVLAAGAAGAVAIANPLIALPKGTEGYNKSGDTAAENCGPERSLVIHAPTDLWPPNHKYYTDIYAEATDTLGGPISLDTVGYHDQYDGDIESQGAGNTGDDITSNDEQATPSQVATGSADSDSGYPEVAATESGQGEVHTDWKARAERAGTVKDAREYTLKATANFAGSSCSVTVKFLVPHDMRPENR